MDLFDIFSGAEKEARDAAPKADTPLESQARAAAVAYDATLAKEAQYKIERDYLMAEVEKQLADLKRGYDEAREVSNATRDALFKAMDEAGVNRVEMADRKDIEIKVTPGGKKGITKKWLTEEFGKQQANSIWGKVPKKPDSRNLVIPPRFEDEPTD